MLKLDARIWNLTRAPPNEVAGRLLPWHAIASSQKKLYSYRLCFAPAMNPMERHHRTHIPEPINVELLERTLACYQGRHDFRAFAGMIEQNQRKKGKDYTDTVRHVHSVTFVKEGVCGDNYRVDFVLDGALYKMVRNMMGTALAVSKGSLDEGTFMNLLHQQQDDQTVTTRADNPCKPAHPEGLTLTHVFYPDGF